MDVKKTFEHDCEGTTWTHNISMKWVKKIQLIIDNGKGILDSSYIFPNDKCNALYE